MDFLDPKKRRRRDVLNIVGYGLIAIALAFAVRLLLYQASGVCLDKNYNVDQCGLVFMASLPSSAQIRINGVLDKAQTDTRQSLVSDDYTFSYSRPGYNSWQQNVNVEGGQILRLDYAMLFPSQLKTSNTKKYDAGLRLATQSPDRRWLLVQQPGSDTVFDQFDLKSSKPVPTEISLPANLITSGINTSWTVGEWSNDNKHVVLQHGHDGITEFILVDRTDTTKSVNLNSLLGLNPTKLSLIDKKFNRFYVFDAAAQTLKTARLDAPSPQDYLTDVLEYRSYGDDIMLYASSKTATTGKVGIVLLLSGKSYFLREVSGGTTYLLNLTQYDRKWYVAIGAQSENKIYVYKNPNVQLSSNLGQLVPSSVLKTTQANRLSFSSNARFVMAENGSQFSVYDAEVDKTYAYNTNLPLDAPQAYANWMDGARLMYVSSGKLVVFDFNQTNMQSLAAADPAFTPFFAPNYRSVYQIAPAAAGSQSLTSTALRTAADQ